LLGICLCFLFFRSLPFFLPFLPFLPGSAILNVLVVLPHILCWLYMLYFVTYCVVILCYIVLLMYVISDSFSSKIHRFHSIYFYLPALSIYCFPSVLLNVPLGTIVVALFCATLLEGLPVAHA
jgi:hypothetical protein